MLYDKVKRFIAGAPRPGFLAGFALACLLTAGSAWAKDRAESSTTASPASLYAPIPGTSGQSAPIAGTALDGGFLPKVEMANPGARTDAGAVIVAPEGGTFPMSQPVCSSAPQTIVIVGTTAVQVPASQLAGRKALRVCVSLENAGSPKVKCLLDGTPGMTFTPDVGVAQGDVLGPGDCYVYPVDTTHVVKCVSDTASTGVLTWEC